MDVTMIGIDHDHAPIEVREAFSFTKMQVTKTIQQWEQTGCLLLSTCNRTELWVSGEHDASTLCHLLCSAKGIEEDTYRRQIICRQGKEAVSHLLQLTCGLKSRIYGEDQILAQVKDALILSRRCDKTDAIIEKVFQTAVAAAKKVKSSVITETTNPSAAQNSLQIIEKTFKAIKGLSCLVIGSGNMGKLVASLLAEKGALVSITQRKRKHSGCLQEPLSINYGKIIDYEERIRNIEGYQVVISATASPHCTIKAEDLDGLTFDDRLWIDLAVPRDIEPEIKTVPGITLIDMDDVGDYSSQDDRQSYREALELLTDYEDDLEQWFAFRDHIDTVKRISTLIRDDVDKRSARSTDIPAANQRAVEKLLFGLKDTLPRDKWRECFAALEQSAERETLKR